jgi:hypothetical protein
MKEGRSKSNRRCRRPREEQRNPSHTSLLSVTALTTRYTSTMLLVLLSSTWSRTTAALQSSVPLSHDVRRHHQPQIRQRLRLRLFGSTASRATASRAIASPTPVTTAAPAPDHTENTSALYLPGRPDGDQVSWLPWLPVQVSVSLSVPTVRRRPHTAVCWQNLLNARPLEESFGFVRMRR